MWDIQAHIEEIYGITVSSSLVSAAIEAVMDEALAWRNRPLEATYAIIHFDALGAKIRDEGMVRNKAVYLAIGVTCAATKEILGLWIPQTVGGQILDARDDGAPRPRYDGHSDHRCRWHPGLPRGAHGRVPGHRRPNLHCPPDPLLDVVCLLGRSARRSQMS